MLDEEEFDIVDRLYSECMRATPQAHLEAAETGGSSIDERFRPVREAYEKMAGMADCHQNAIMHHRISIYGPPCEYCGKPLRTPIANFCAACWQKRARGKKET